tara:strand:+ start:645 stop:923 length:279 start_codon:yes stop_codon:yes gene_type:complete
VELNLLIIDVLFFKYIHQMKFKFLVKNQNNKDRAIRLIIALFLIPIPIIFGETKWAIFAGWLGIALLFNALSGNCYAYRLMGINSCKIPKKQ